jgi:carbonic anhydrase
VSHRDELLRANAEYAAAFEHGHLAKPPAKKLAVLTCIDARIDPIRLLGLEPGDANVVRNAGGLVTDDALRSLVVSRWLLGTREVVVIGHTDCGLEGLTNEDVHARLREEAGVDASAIDFQPFEDLEESVRTSVRRVLGSPLLAGVEASGWVYDVRTGRLREVT